MVVGNTLIGLAVQKQSRSGNNFAFSIDSLCFIIFEESRGSRITPAKLGPHFELEKTPVAV